MATGSPEGGDVVGNECGLHYVLRMPRGLRENRPLLFFLHGAGERGPPDGTLRDRVLKHGPWKARDAGEFFILAPQCPDKHVWPGIIGDALALLDQVIREYRVDKSRVYATGLSMGGFGVWAAAVARPDLFAAVAPVCGGFVGPQPRNMGLAALLRVANVDVLPSDVAPVRHIPAHVFHGDRDVTVNPRGSVSSFEALGGEARGRNHGSLHCHIFSDTGHHCWRQAYHCMDLLRWLLQHRSGSGAEAESPPCAVSRGSSGGEDEWDWSTDDEVSDDGVPWPRPPKRRRRAGPAAAARPR